jgi:hypothetical protein
VTASAPKKKPAAFLISNLADSEFAGRITDTLVRSGLTVSWNQGRNVDLRKELRECAVTVVVLSGSTLRQPLTASVLFEVGAAMGAGKPIYAVVDDLTARLPFGVPNLQVLPANRAEEIASRFFDFAEAS